MGKVYIFGHKKPDTDSVTAAISLSYLKNKLGINSEAKVLGRLNNETKYALKFFNVKYPEYLNDVKTQIKDVNYIKKTIKERESIKNCYDILRKDKLSGLPVVDNHNKLTGIITLNDISSYFIDGDFKKLNTSYDNLLNVINGECVLKFDKEITGNILVASYKSTTFLNNIELNNNTILIVGDRHSIIEYAVTVGIKMIILVGNGDIHDNHLELAKQNKVNIIRTIYDTFDTVKKVNLSNYIKDIIITKHPVIFNESDYLSDFIEISNQTKHTNYPIVDNKNNCLGFIRLVDVNDKTKKKVILVDHNEINQSIDGLEEAEVLEVIDHHKLDAFKTSSPINFRIMSVGSTNTIIHKMYEENNITIPKSIAGIMLSGIISDTLFLKSPTTTQIDRQAVFHLSKIADIDYREFGLNMFRAGSSIKGKSLEEVLYSDYKVFKVGSNECGIGQIFTTDYSSLKLNVDKMIELLNQVSINSDYEVVCLFITDVMREGSYIIFNDKSKTILEDSFDIESLEQCTYLDGIVSRKKQIIPYIIEVLERK
ncbi:MAG: putative manganese-dependent inorganic diphosphatase [bacterium]|nr:putative manganese-dependent inorganic diphosphatase [bacterium]